MWPTKIIEDGVGTIVLLPDEISFGPDVDVVITRIDDVVTIRKATPDEIAETDASGA